MQYVEQIKLKPSKIEQKDVETPFRLSANGEIIVTEQRILYLPKKEFLKSIKAINNKLGYFEYLLSDHYLNGIKEKIQVLLKKKKLYEDYLKELTKSGV